MAIKTELENMMKGMFGQKWTKTALKMGENPLEQNGFLKRKLMANIVQE